MSNRCGFLTETGQCSQETGPRRLFCYYHSKVVDGFAEPVSEYLSPEELRSTLHGRSKGDGRRLDAYCSDDQLEREDDTSAQGLLPGP